MFSCRVYLPLQLVAQAFTYIPATWLLCIRVLALYHSSKWLKYAVWGCFILTHLTVMIVGSISLANTSGMFSRLSLQTYCSSHNIGSVAYSTVLHDCSSHAPRLLSGALLALVSFPTSNHTDSLTLTLSCSCQSRCSSWSCNSSTVLSTGISCRK